MFQTMAKTVKYNRRLRFLYFHFYEPRNWSLRYPLWIRPYTVVQQDNGQDSCFNWGTTDSSRTKHISTRNLVVFCQQVHDLLLSSEIHENWENNIYFFTTFTIIYKSNNLEYVFFSTKIEKSYLVLVRCLVFSVLYFNIKSVIWSVSILSNVLFSNCYRLFLSS
jgi:hypothetical protein